MDINSYLRMLTNVNCGQTDGTILTLTCLQSYSTCGHSQCKLIMLEDCKDPRLVTFSAPDCLECRLGGTCDLTSRISVPAP